MPSWTEIVTALATAASAIFAIFSVGASIISATCSCFSSIAVGAAVLIAFSQVMEAQKATQQAQIANKESQRATDAAVHKTVFDILSSKNALEARWIVFNRLADKDFHDWSEDEREAANAVCRTYDAAGQMVSYKLVNEKFVAENWAQSLVRSWDILEPYVQDLRNQRNAQEIWDNFQDLARLAKGYQKMANPTKPPQKNSPTTAIN